MELVVNGENKQIPVKNITSLLAHLGIPTETVVVEKNGEIIEKDKDEGLVDGDKLEIVRFVGGG